MSVASATRGTPEGIDVPSSSAIPHCVFSVDVEDWFHILDLPSTPPVAKWDSLPSRVGNNFQKLLDILDETGTKATCFFLAWVAKKFPHLVNEASRRGHEIASHGFAHRLAYELGAEAFFEDCRVSKQILEDISGSPVLGYRAAGFSTTNDCGWFIEKLVEAGYKYDSSIFPARRGHGGIEGARREPHTVNCPAGEIVEFPVTVETFIGRPMCFFGGGYLRLFPYSLIRRMSLAVLRSGRPVLFYIHPREIDPNHPRLAMNAKRQFKSYVNLRTTEPKIRRILKEFKFKTFAELFAEQHSAAAGAVSCLKSSARPSYGEKTFATRGEA
ncbi:MAG TPA: XrtA system polysaccharide deacetylase [Candidatus Acidoferrales bacterium]|nr:XrtA system polysaccharide deacetylase [Candidatus Acidoferrales bacterium]